MTTRCSHRKIRRGELQFLFLAEELRGDQTDCLSNQQVYSRAARLSGRAPQRRGVRGQGRGREGGDDDEFEQEQEESIEPTERAAA